MLQRDSEPLEKWSVVVVVVAMLQPARPDSASLWAAILPVRGVIRRTHIYTYKVVIYYCTAIETLPPNQCTRNSYLSIWSIFGETCHSVPFQSWRSEMAADGRGEGGEALNFPRRRAQKEGWDMKGGDVLCVCHLATGRAERVRDFFFFIRILLSFGSARIDPSAHPHPPSLHPLDVSSSFSSFHFEINSKQIE